MLPGFYGSDLTFERRGGSNISTDTIPASAYPTVPPSSTHTHFQSIPKIGGSEGGFIGLVVGLGVILIGSCIGVFFLLRYRKHGGRTIRGKSGEVGVEVPPQAGFPRRRGTLFGFRSENPSKAGWIRTSGNDDEEWDANDNLHGHDSVHMDGYGHLKEPQSPLSPISPVHFGGRPYAAVDNAGSVSSVRLVAPGQETPRAQNFRDPFEHSRSPSPMPERDAPSSHHDHDQHAPNPRASIDSGTTITSLPGGTKFREDLA